MTEEGRIQEIKARCEATTLGPWETDEYASGVNTKAFKYTDKRTWGYGCGGDFICDLNDREYHEYGDLVEQTANAAFISHSREDIPYLLDLVAAKEAETAYLKIELDIRDDTIEKTLDTNRKLMDEIARLKESCGRCPAHAKLEAELDEIMSEPKQERRWIPVDEDSDELPYDDGSQKMVLCYFGDGQIQTFDLYDIRYWNEIRRSEGRNDVAMYYMELPEAPGKGDCDAP